MELCHITKEKAFSKNSTKTATWKLVPRPSCVCKELSSTSIGKWNFWSKQLTWDYMRYVLAKLSKFVQISTLTSPDFFSEESLKIKKGLELVSRPNFSESFLIKNFLLEYCINWPNLITRLFLLLKLFSKLCFVFHA